MLKIFEHVFYMHPYELKDLIRLKTAVIGRSKVDSHDVEGQRGVKQLPPGHLLLRELFEQRLCTVDIVLEIADHAVSSWGVVMPRGGVCNGISGNVETGHTMSPLFQCRQLDLLVSIIARHNDETQHRRIFLYLLQSIHRIKASKDHTIDISQLIHLYSLLAAVCSFVGIGEVREENTTVDSKILRWIMEAALQLLEQYVLPRESLNFFQFHASRFLKFNSRLKESSTLPRRILNSDLEVTSDQVSETDDDFFGSLFHIINMDLVLALSCGVFKFLKYSGYVCGVCILVTSAGLCFAEREHAS